MGAFNSLVLLHTAPSAAVPPCEVWLVHPQSSCLAALHLTPCRWPGRGCGFGSMLCHPSGCVTATGCPIALRSWLRITPKSTRKDAIY